jgi:hypothetical protein
MPTLDPAFLLTPPWLKLTPAAQAALRGMLEFAIHKHGEWSVEATAPQISAWVGSESGLGAKSIAAGITELEAYAAQAGARRAGPRACHYCSPAAVGARSGGG